MNEELHRQLPTEMPPPPALEERVIAALHSRRLLASSDAGHTTQRRNAAGWRVMRMALASAASVALIGLGVLIGRATLEPPAGTLTGAESDLYALLLYETPGYDRPAGAEAANRYAEYSRWVRLARERGQFVTGEDLAVERGWLVTPGPGEVAIMETDASAPAAPLSGIFFVRADSPEHALELAGELPHLAHGGEVLVQKTVPTVSAP